MNSNPSFFEKIRRDCSTAHLVLIEDVAVRASQVKIFDGSLAGEDGPNKARTTLRTAKSLLSALAVDMIDL